MTIDKQAANDAYGKFGTPSDPKNDPRPGFWERAQAVKVAPHSDKADFSELVGTDLLLINAAIRPFEGRDWAHFTFRLLEALTLPYPARIARSTQVHLNKGAQVSVSTSQTDMVKAATLVIEEMNEAGLLPFHFDMPMTVVEIDPTEIEGKEGLPITIRNFMFVEIPMPAA